MKSRWSINRSRKWRTVGVVAAASLMATLTMTSTPAQAAAPANDSWTSPTPVTSLPYRATVNTTQATTDSVRAPGTRGWEGHSVWWRVRLPKSGPVYVSAKGTDFNDWGSVFKAPSATATPDQWILLDNFFAHPRSPTLVQLTAGDIYYVMVSTRNNGSGGIAKLMLRRPARVSFNMSPNGVFSPVDGSARVLGSMKSSRPDSSLRMSLTLRQLVNGHVATGRARVFRLPTTSWSAWSVRIGAASPFKAGPARLLDGSRVRVYDEGVYLRTVSVGPTVITLR